MDTRKVHHLEGLRFRPVESLGGGLAPLKLGTYHQGHATWSQASFQDISAELGNRSSPAHNLGHDAIKSRL